MLAMILQLLAVANAAPLPARAEAHFADQPIPAGMSCVQGRPHPGPMPAGTACVQASHCPIVPHAKVSSMQPSDPCDSLAIATAISSLGSSVAVANTCANTLPSDERITQHCCSQNLAQTVCCYCVLAGAIVWITTALA